MIWVDSKSTISPYKREAEGNLTREKKEDNVTRTELNEVVIYRIVSCHLMLDDSSIGFPPRVFHRNIPLPAPWFLLSENYFMSLDSKLGGDIFLLCYSHEIVVICYSSHGKLIHYSCCQSGFPLVLILLFCSYWTKIWEVGYYCLWLISMCLVQCSTFKVHCLIASPSLNIFLKLQSSDCGNACVSGSSCSGVGIDTLYFNGYLEPDTGIAVCWHLGKSGPRRVLLASTIL